MRMEKMRVLLLFLFAGIIFVSGCVTQTTTTIPTTTTQGAVGVKEFEVVARQFSFEPSVIEVKKGDKVRLKITSVDVTHGFAINEFNVNERLEPGKTVIVEFVADKTGTFSFYCSIFCGTGHSGMRGELVVK